MTADNGWRCQLLPSMDGGLLLGPPRTDNAYCLWIQHFHSALNEKSRAAFVVANSARTAHSCPMKTTESVGKYASEHSASNEDALTQGMTEKSKKFVENSADVYA